MKKTSIVQLNTERGFEMGIDVESFYPIPPKGTVVSLEEIEKICMSWGRFDLWEKIKANPPKKPFIPDGASCFPDRLRKGVDLYIPSFFHDLWYWVGGSLLDRLLADIRLALDSINISGASTAVARTLFIGVSVGGVGWLPTRWKWGFGG